MSLLTIEAQIKTKFLADATLSALIGTRLYDTFVPQNTPFPYVRFQRISTNRYQVQDVGGTRQDAGQTRFQFDCCAQTATAVQDAQTIAQALKGIMGTFNAFDSRTAAYGPNTVLNERGTADTRPNKPVYTFTVDMSIQFSDNV